MSLDSDLPDVMDVQTRKKVLKKCKNTKASPFRRRNRNKRERLSNFSDDQNYEQQFISASTSVSESISAATPSSVSASATAPKGPPPPPTDRDFARDPFWMSLFMDDTERGMEYLLDKAKIDRNICEYFRPGYYEPGFSYRRLANSAVETKDMVVDCDGVVDGEC